ncbi:response regulator [Serratia marcescens]|uniref:response regulator n=2 Tax=Enterobacterales TaxID=91347 RepID=UPI001F0BAFD7|nr:response regulator [Serratia marcescens]
MTPTNILIVEDEKEIRRFVRTALESEGLRVFESETLQRGLIEAGTRKPDLIILDLGLPDGDGLSYIRDLRQWSAIPVIVLSARNAEEDKIAALDAGADDYLVKPFALVELQARVRALLRRYQGHSDNLMQVDDLQLNLSSQQVYLQQQPVEVTPKEFAILARLIMRAGQTVNRELLQQDLYTWQDDLGSNTLEVHIHNLRRKLGKDRIRTVRGIGYRLEPSS